MKTFLRVSSLATLLILPVVLSSCGDGSGGTEPDPQPETLASFQLTVPDSITEGEAFALTVKAVGNRASTPLTSYSGSVTLTTTLGTVTPASLTVSAGTGSAQITLTDPGQQTLTASGGGRTGSIGVAVTDLPDPPLEGDPLATLEQVVQDSVFDPNPDDYSNDHPDLPGIYLSHNTVLLAFQVGTTVGEANDLLTPLGAALQGGIHGVADEVPSILILKLATTNHLEMEAALGTLRNDSHVLHVAQDVLLGPDALPPFQETYPPGWEWTTTEGGANHHLKTSRVPQMWNLNRALEKQGRGTRIGIVDVGFWQHDDLIFETFGLPIDHFHGTVIAGTIGAVHSNDLGVEGIYPFLRLENPLGGMVTQALPVFPALGDKWAELTSLGELMVEGIKLFVTQRPDLRVINVSLGYNWVLNGINPTNPAAVNLANTQGALLSQELQGIVSPPLIVVSAGNDNGADAKYGSPMTNAALVQGAFNILVVENIYWDGSQFTRWQSSNVGGHISAPGVLIFSTNVGPSGYADQTGDEFHVGTSFSAGMVTGLASYLLAADKDLNPAQVKKILVDNGAPTGGGSKPLIDAWAAVMGIDELRGDDRVLRMMLDIDDGTPDGNQRVKYADTVEFPDYDSIDADGDGGLGDGGPGDGNVDMSDFRVWRDWYLKIGGLDYDHYDGRDDHPKMDVNDNGVTEDDAGESIYPRGDFNGDGILSLDALAYVPGAFQEEVSDLDVFKRLFDDPVIEKEDLDTLVHSSDITIDASIAFDLWATSPIWVEIVKNGGWIVQGFYLTAQEPRKVFTVKSASQGYRVWVRVGGPGTIRVADSSYKPLGKWWATDAVMWPIKPIHVDVRSTFLTSCDDAFAATVQPISLASLKVGPGDYLFLDGAGGWPAVEELVAVFSASAQIETLDVPAPGDPSKTLTIRTVTDAIALGDNLLGGNTYASPPTRECGGVVTDIPEDFTPFQVSFMKVPDGATHLFVGMASDYYTENDPPFDPVEVQISKWYAPEWHPMGPQPAGPGGGGR
jgi:hypothetical protein